MTQHLLEKLLSERILVLDGGMGTVIQEMNLTAEDFGSESLNGCNEVLNLSRPDNILSIHRQYLEAGADIVETNTFGGTNFVLGEYGLEDKVDQINRKAVEIARQACDEFSTEDKPRFVAGAMGPTTKSLSVTGGITFDEMRDAYEEQAYHLVDSGVDYLLLETALDTLNLKAAYVGILAAFDTLNTSVPVAISCTIETMGSMLAGQKIDAFYTSIEHMNPLYVGLNCATGPLFMREFVQELAEISRFPISVVPNAGIPDPDGNYPEDATMLSDSLCLFAKEGWINILGGCCGTTPAHIKAVAEKSKNYPPRQAIDTRQARISGIDSLILDYENRPYIVGERSNVIGSRAFKRLITEEKFDEASEIARKQVKAGAHIIDICLSNPDRDEEADTVKLYEKVTQMVKAPIMVDSQEANVVEAAFKRTQGKCILNSVNLEDGEKSFEALLPLVKKYGAAVVVGCIEGEMAVEAEEKLDIAAKSHKLITEKYGIPEEDIIFDPLVFPCGTGDENYFGSGAKTIEGCRLIREKFPRCGQTLGISNVSFGLPNAGREVLNSVFLHHCVKAGLDTAIVNSEKLVSYSQITDEEKALCDDLLWYEPKEGEDPIANFAAYFRDKTVTEKPKVDRTTQTVEARLKASLLEGSKEFLIEDLDEALKKYDPLGVINGPLMSGMAIVGKLFNDNELIVAEVLQSASVMKAAVAHLEKFMEVDDRTYRGTIVLATVKGDVHDIGKNLVEIIFKNNGFKVIDLGIKCLNETLIEACLEHKPDMIGLSGLLVKSAQQMVNAATDLKARGIDIPILVGGAALTEGFTAIKIAPQYDGPVIYCPNVMQGLDVANHLLDTETNTSWLDTHFKTQASIRENGAEGAAKKVQPLQPRVVYDHTAIKAKAPNFDPTIITASFEEIWPYINQQMLYTGHLGLKGSIAKILSKETDKQKKIVGAVEKIREDIIRENMLTAKAIYQFFKVKAEGDDLVILDSSGKNEIQRFNFLRQPGGKQQCLTDFINPDKTDEVCFFVLTCGDSVAEKAKQLMDDGHYFESHCVSAIALEMAEGFAELLHQQIRKEWQIPDPANTTSDDLYKLKYTGLRVSFGYPACPNLEDQAKLWDLLSPTDAIGVELSDTFMMSPEASVSALVFHHPQARYFKVATDE